MPLNESDITNGLYKMIESLRVKAVLNHNTLIGIRGIGATLLFIPIFVIALKNVVRVKTLQLRIFLPDITDWWFHARRR